MRGYQGRYFPRYVICKLNSTENVSEFLDHHLRPVMKAGKSERKARRYLTFFLEKIKEIGEVPSHALFVTADVTFPAFHPKIVYARCNTCMPKSEEQVDKKCRQKT